MKKIEDLKEEINECRKKLNNEIATGTVDLQAVIRLSQILDELIAEFYKACQDKGG